MTRDQWLERVAHGLAPALKRLGCTLPKFRVSIGFPSSGRRGKVLPDGRIGGRIGECHARERSGDKTFELLIRPDRDDPVEVSGVLAHELVHACVGLEHKHGPEFRRVATGLGLEGKMTATVPGPAFIKLIEPILAKAGDLPHAALSLGSLAVSDAPPKQSARLIKCECSECGYKARVTRTWLDDPDYGPPLCPQHGPMGVHG